MDGKSSPSRTNAKPKPDERMVTDSSYYDGGVPGNQGLKPPVKKIGGQMRKIKTSRD
jgi:hypothetical protein